jgi:hypothetical protein
MRALAQDLRRLAQEDYARLAGDLTENKRPLTSLIQRLTAE